MKKAQKKSIFIKILIITFLTYLMNYHIDYIIPENKIPFADATEYMSSANKKKKRKR